MELQRGVCNLCLENSKVLTSSDAEEFCRYLPLILPENFLSTKDFQSIKNFLKICALCCFKIQTVNDMKANIKDAEWTEEGLSNHNCRFCKENTALIKMKGDWKYFNERTEGFLRSKDFPVLICSRCFFYFDTIFNVKTKLLYKFPQLSRKNNQKNSDTPKRKSLSKSPPSSKKRKIFDNCLNYLQPLCNNTYHIDDELKSDTRLYRKVAYVNLTQVNNIDVKETPKTKPIIKIKLKPPRFKKHEDIKSKTFENLSKSEEVSKVNSYKKRRHSFDIQNVQENEEEKREENLEETPKAAGIADLVPKRRVSVFLEETDAGNEDKSDISEVNLEEIDKMVDKYIGIVTSTPDQTKDGASEEVETNGVEEVAHENGDAVVESAPTPQQLDANNGKKPEEVAEKDETVNIAVEDTNSNSSQSSTDSSKNSTTNASDSDPGEKNTNESSLDKESLNGSERKKKRVTFSDEVI